MSRSLEKGLRLLLALGEGLEREFHGVALKDVAAAAALDKATAHRLLRSLAKYDFVRRDAGGRYALGSGAVGLAHATFHANRLVQRLIPIMRAVNEATGETVNLSERHELTSVSIYELPSSQQIRYTTRIGQATPLHLGASSRVTLAFSRPDVREAVLSGPLDGVTGASVTSRDDLEITLQRVRADGYAISHGERVPGTIAIAVPLLDAEGCALGSLAILWPSRGTDPDRQRCAAWPALLRNAVATVQNTL